MSLKKFLISLGVTLIITGCVSDVYHFYQLFKNDPNEVTFLVPGQTELEVTKAGTYTLWHDYKTIHKGIVYNSPDELEAGTSITALNSFGQSVPLIPNSGTSSSSGSHSKISIGEFEINAPTTLLIEVQGEMNPKVFSFSETRFLKNFIAIFLSTFVLIFPGGGLIFWGCLLKDKTAPTPLP